MAAALTQGQLVEWHHPPAKAPRAHAARPAAEKREQPQPGCPTRSAAPRASRDPGPALAPLSEGPGPFSARFWHVCGDASPGRPWALPVTGAGMAPGLGLEARRRASRKRPAGHGSGTAPEGPPAQGPLGGFQWGHLLRATLACS